MADFDWLRGLFFKVGIPAAIVVGIIMYVKSCITGEAPTP
jgi:hypothetical protein